MDMATCSSRVDSAQMCQTTPAPAEADAMHVLLVLRADQLEGCAENSEVARELTLIAEALEAYECKHCDERSARR